MSNAQNFAYSVVQIVHNFGAVATLGGSFAAAGNASSGARNKLAWLTLAGWGTQTISGAAFGMVSLFFYQRLPDIAGVAVIALVIKILCAAIGFLLVAAFLFRGSSWTERKQSRVWYSSSMLAAVALSAAAFLRWFS